MVAKLGSYGQYNALIGVFYSTDYPTNARVLIVGGEFKAECLCSRLSVAGYIGKAARRLERAEDGEVYCSPRPTVAGSLYCDEPLSISLDRNGISPRNRENPAFSCACEKGVICLGN